MKLTTIICNSIFFSVVCITSSSLCMQRFQIREEQTIVTNDPSLYVTNSYLTKTIIPTTISNQLTLDSSFLFITCHRTQGGLLHSNVAPNIFCIKTTDEGSYNFKPDIIDKHIQDDKGNWHIKTIIEKQKIKPAGSVIECITSHISEWLTNIKQNRKTIKNPPVQIDQYTQTTVYPKGSVLAECHTILSPDQYTKFLLRVINNNILVLKHKKDLLREMANTHN